VIHLTENLSADQHQQWHHNGYFILPGFVESDVGDAMLERVVQIARQADGELRADNYLISPEQNLRPNLGDSADAEAGVSKIFRLHRDEVFKSFIESPEIINIGTELLGPGLDCFLSQFIFKNPGAWGQPWHQDSYYFPFDTSPQVGLWLAVTEATLENGCLWVLPGSHRQPIHKHIPDRRPNANFGYVEIVDQDCSAEIPVMMNPGDLLVFHSHLMHRSKDNLSDRLRAAMVYHLALHGTKDLSDKPARVNDWMPLPA
jgi:ectoine hydroxylase-related dioxygenase (phytanoyl-CoA dioxygenase family)